MRDRPSVRSGTSERDPCAAASRRQRDRRSQCQHWAGSSGSALVDHEKTRDLRELRLLNESLIKPVLQSAPGVAEVASVGGLEKQYQVKLFPPLLSERAISSAGPDRCAGRFPGGGRPHHRGHQPRISAAGSLDAGSLEKLEFLVLGRDRAGEAVISKTSATCNRATTSAARSPISMAPARSWGASPSWSRAVTCWR